MAILAGVIQQAEPGHYGGHWLCLWSIGAVAVAAAVAAMLPFRPQCSSRMFSSNRVGKHFVGLGGGQCQQSAKVVLPKCSTPNDL